MRLVNRACFFSTSSWCSPSYFPEHMAGGKPASSKNSSKYVPRRSSPRRPSMASPQETQRVCNADSSDGRSRTGGRVGSEAGPPPSPTLPPTFQALSFASGGRRRPRLSPLQSRLLSVIPSCPPIGASGPMWLVGENPVLVSSASSGALSPRFSRWDSVEEKFCATGATSSSSFPSSASSSASSSCSSRRTRRQTSHNHHSVGSCVPTCWHSPPHTFAYTSSD